MRRVEVANMDLLPQVGEMLKAGATVTLSVKGNSMQPFIVGRRDSVVLSPVEAGMIRRLDIVLALIDGNRYVLHRIVRIAGSDISLLGDGNNSHSIEHCSAECIVGRATQIVRNGRTVDCNSRGQRRLARLWIHLSPIRRYLLFAYRHLSLKRSR